LEEEDEPENEIGKKTGDVKTRYASLVKEIIRILPVAGLGTANQASER